MKKVWLITGCSRGFGKVWTGAALARGDRVIATARNPKTIQSIANDFGDNALVLEMDVCSDEQVGSVVRTGVEHFGRIDILVNNAGYGLFGPAECVPIHEAQKVIDTNLLGSLRLIQNILPVMRKQKSGHIIQVSSIAGLLPFADMSLYVATKWAVEGMVESLMAEVRGFGIKVTLVEPGPHDTDWIGASSVRPERLSVYPGHLEIMQTMWPRLSLGDPLQTVKPILDLVDSESPPERLLLGSGLLDLVKQSYSQRLLAMVNAEA